LGLVGSEPSRAATEAIRLEVPEGRWPVTESRSTEDAQASAEELATLVEAARGVPSGGSPREAGVEELATLVEELSASLDREQVNDLFWTARSGLAWARTPADAEAWTKAALALVRKKPKEELVREVVEILKYPTASGSVQEILVEAIRAYEPDAPTEVGGGSLRGIAAKYGLTLESAPICPAPFPDSRKFACPSDSGANDGDGKSGLLPTWMALS
jgi:hypothetical protein